VGIRRMVVAVIGGISEALRQQQVIDAQRMRELNKRCQEALAPILDEEGFDARIVFYPREGKE